MLLCFIGCIFGWSFVLLCDHCSHFHMIVLCLIKLLICFTSYLLHRIFTCYIILVLLILVLPWGSKAFCASVLGYRYCVLSSSQVLDLGVSEFCIVSKLTFKSRVFYRMFFHGIPKGGNCKFVIYNYVLCWLYSMTKSVVIELICSFYFVGFYCIRFSIKLVKNRAWNKDQCSFPTSLQEVREKSTWEEHVGIWRVKSQAIFRKYFAR